MKVVVAAFNQEKALVGAFSVITNLRMELFEALVSRYRAAVDISAGQRRDDPSICGREGMFKNFMINERGLLQRLF